MLTRLMPQDRPLRWAVGALLVAVIALITIGIGEAIDRNNFFHEKDLRESIVTAVVTSGASSSEAAVAVKALGQTGPERDLVALLDPETGKIVAAWPESWVGKRVEEVALPGGAKLPALSVLQFRKNIVLPRQEPGSYGIRIQPIYPWIEVLKEAPVPPSEPVRAPQMAEVKPLAVLVVAMPAQGPDVRIVVFSIAAVTLGLSVITFILSLATWVFRDARRRGERALAWGLLTLLTNVVGAALYLGFRKEILSCPACAQSVEKAYDFCPRCGQGLKPTCAQCAAPVQPGWLHCVKCGAPTQPGAEPASQS